MSAGVVVLFWYEEEIRWILTLTVHDVEISHSRRVCSCVLTNSILHPSSDIFMVWLRAMLHWLNAAVVSCSHYTDCEVSLCLMLDAQTLPSAATQRCAALVRYGMLASAAAHSLGRWGCLKCRGGRVEFGHLIRHFKHRLSHVRPCAVSYLHNCALTTRQPRIDIVVSLEGRKAS